MVATILHFPIVRLAKNKITYSVKDPRHPSPIIMHKCGLCFVFTVPIMAHNMIGGKKLVYELEYTKLEYTRVAPVLYSLSSTELYSSVTLAAISLEQIGGHT